MNTKKLILTLILIFSLIFGVTLTKADENIYSKIDNLVKNNREKAENFYKALGQIYNYTGEKLGFTTFGVNMSDIYGFNLDYIIGKELYNIGIFSKNQYKGLNLEDYTLYAYLQNFDTILLSLNQGKIYLYNNVKNEFIQKYNDVINGKILLNSKEFEQINTYGRTYDNIFNIRGNFSQKKPFNSEFILDETGTIKGIGFYCFEGQDFLGNLKYKIYSVKNKALLEVDIDVIGELSFEENQKYIDKFMKNTDSDFDIEKYKKVFFKNGYFENENKSKEYWLNIKNEIDFYKEIVKNI